MLLLETWLQGAGSANGAGAVVRGCPWLLLRGKEALFLEVGGGVFDHDVLLLRQVV